MPGHVYGTGSNSARLAVKQIHNNMIDKIIHYSITHKINIGMMVIAIIAGGIWAMNSINVDSTPDITNNQVQVITVSPNLSTTDIEQYVTYPVEMAMSNLPGVEDLRSISRFGLSVVLSIPAKFILLFRPNVVFHNISPVLFHKNTKIFSKKHPTPP